MTRHVVSVRPEAPIQQAGELMLQHDISGLSVIGADGRVVGMVTERDFMRCSGVRGDARPRWLEVVIGRTQLSGGATQRCGSTVAEIMTRDPVTVTEDVPIEDVVRLMDTRASSACW
jgi:CBS domain-containing protein